MKVEFENFESFIDFLKKIPEESLDLLFFNRVKTKKGKKSPDFVVPKSAIKPKPDPVKYRLDIAAFTKIGTFTYRLYKADNDFEDSEKILKELGGVEIPTFSVHSEKLII